MPKILDTLTAVAGSKNFSGYVIVVELPSAEAPIPVEQIEAAIH